jgi:hypothetical protein
MSLRHFKKLGGMLALGGVSFAASAQFVSYTIAVDPGYTLSDMTVFSVFPSEAYGAANAVPVQVAGGSEYTGSILIGDFSVNGTYLALLGVFTPSGGSPNVAASMPSTLASTFGSSATWTDFDTTADFVGGGTLPPEAATLSSIQEAGNANGFINSYYYMPASDPVLAGVGTSATIVGFDGAVDIGTITFSVPEPSSIGLFAFSVGCLALRWRKRA